MKNFDEKIEVLRKVLKQGDISEARIECENLIKNYPAHVELNFLLGFIFNQLGQKNRAEELLQNAIYIDPNYYNALMELSLFYEKNGQHEKASNFRERAFRISNNISGK